MPAPLISIGLPVYNAAPWLPDALRSIFAQTFADWELIAVDDGSTDGSAELLRKLSDPRVRFLHDGRRLGLGARLNQVARAARGRFLARMDADDLFHPERLQRQLDHLQRHPELDVLGCAMLVVDRDLRPVGLRQVPQEHSEICRRLLAWRGLIHATVLARAEWVRAHPYDESLRGCEDQELWFSSHESSRFANLAEPLYFNREFDSFSLARFVRAKGALLRLLWRWRRHFGWTATGRAMARQAASVVVFPAAAISGLTPRLLRRRNQPVDAATREQFQAVLARIRATPLPFTSPQA